MKSGLRPTCHRPVVEAEGAQDGQQHPIRDDDEMTDELLVDERVNREGKCDHRRTRPEPV